MMMLQCMIGYIILTEKSHLSSSRRYDLLEVDYSSHVERIDH